jgi:hypothetical protein
VCKHSRWSDLASSAFWHPRGQVLGLDLWQCPRQDSACNTYALEYDPAQRRVGSSRRWTGSSSSSVCLHIPSHLLGRTSKWNLVLLASPGAGVATVEGSGIQGGENWGDQMYRRNTTKENEEVVIGSTLEARCLYGKQLMCCTTSCALLAPLVSLCGYTSADQC